MRCLFYAPVFLLTFILYSFFPQLAWAGGDDINSTNNNTTTQNASVTSPTVPSSESITVTPTTLLQTGTNNYANLNSNLGSLNYPNCGGTCAFAIMRTTSANNINGITSNQFEAVTGIIHAFSSPDQTNAQNNRQLVNIQQKRSESEMGIIYIKMIADACQNKDIIKAELTAKALARVWNVDEKSLGCRALVNIQQQRSESESEISTTYTKIIADACQNKDIIKAELAAKELARIRNVDYEGLSCG